MTRLEVVVHNIADAKSAETGGASSIEVISDLDIDGLTPEVNLVREIVHEVQIDIQVIIRPHALGYVYSKAEKQSLLDQAARFVEAGATGIVIGALTRDDSIDRAFIDSLRNLGCRLTFHRAIDQTRSISESLEALTGRVDRILTSGGKSTAAEGIDALKEMVAAFGDKFVFAAAGKITLDNASSIARTSRVHEIHMSSGVRTGGTVDVEKVRQVVTILNRASSAPIVNGSA